jgi:hypothetical protein
MGNKLKQLIFAFSSVMILSSVVFAEQATIDENEIKRIEKLRAITIEDGITVDEAQILSSEYFWKYVSGCGNAGKPIDGDDYWISTAYFGYAGKPLKEKILVEKSTGTVSMKGRPTIVNPLKAWKVSP